MAILTLQQRIRECGRIRIGQKGAKGQPEKLTTFRFTSFDKRAIEAAASLWGGTVKQCTDKDLKGQWEVITNASEIPIFASPMEPSQYMELWSGGGCARRCDGHTELLSGKPCMCNPDVDSPANCCKPTTRLPVILPDLPGLGVWRLESKGWNSAAELVQSFSLLRSLNGYRDMAEGLLAIEERTSRSNGQTKRFMVPVIRIGLAPRQVLAQAQAAGLPTGMPQTGVPQSIGSGAQALPASAHETEAHVLKDPNPRGAVFAIAAEMGLPPHGDPHKPMYYEVFGKVLGRELDTLSGLSEDEWQTLCSWIRKVHSLEKVMPKAWQTYLDAKPVEHDPMAVPSEDEYDPFSDTDEVAEALPV